MKMSAQSLAVRRRDRALFPCPEWRKQYEETNHHCCNIRSLSGPVCGYVATELTSRGNNRTAHASRCNRHTARSSGDSRDGRSHTARGRKGRSNTAGADIVPEPSPAQMPPSSKVPVLPEQDVTPPQEPEPTPAPDSEPDNMVYVPDFGWIKGQGPNHAEYAEDMYENDNKIRIME